jgi:hypothetical protein
MLATVCRSVQVPGYPIHINPHIGKLNNQSKQSKEVASPKVISGTIHINARESGRQPGSLLQPIFPSWGPTHHVT